MDEELREMLNQDIGIKPKIGTEFGQPVHGEAQTVKSYWEENFQTITNSEGQEVVSKAFGIVPPDTEVKPEDLIVDPSGNESMVLNVQTTPDIIGGNYPHHKEVYV